MFARDDKRPPPPNSENRGPPPWISSFSSVVSSDSASASSTTTSDDDDGNNDATTSIELAQVASPITTFTGATTLSTRLSLGSSVIELASNTGSVVGQSTPLTRRPTSAQWWPYAATLSSDSISYTTSPAWTHPAWGSLSDGKPPSQSETASSGSSVTDPTPLPNHRSSDQSDGSHFNGAILAGIIVPIIILLTLGTALLCCLRRRRRRRAQPTPPNTLTHITEKILPKRSSSTTANLETHDAAAPPPQPHLITSPQNNTYYTGLDTMSMMSSEPRGPSTSSEEPPPPYWIHGAPAQRSVSMRSGVSSIVPPAPMLLAPPAAATVASLQGSARSPFDDPPAEVARTPSFRSITSTLYSSNASLVEARPARRSVGGAHMVGGEEEVVSPFADPR